MPTYDYKCDGCGHTFEEFQYFSEEPLKVCPKCGTDKLRRLFGTGAAVIFKGSGFYETDYRSDSYKAAAKADTEGAKGTAPGTTGTTSTPATGSADSATKKDTNSPKSTS